MNETGEKAGAERGKQRCGEYGGASAKRKDLPSF